MMAPMNATEAYYKARLRWPQRAVATAIFNRHCKLSISLSARGDHYRDFWANSFEECFEQAKGVL